MSINEAVGIVRRNLKEHHEFGSLFQFFVSILTRVIYQNTTLSEEESHKLAIKCIAELGM